MDFLWSLMKEAIIQLFADDTEMLINGKFIQTLSEVLQTALGLVQQRCYGTELSINPSKTVVISFTNMRVL
jgi:hypothetical protein